MGKSLERGYRQVRSNSKPVDLATFLRDSMSTEEGPREEAGRGRHQQAKDKVVGENEPASSTSVWDFLAFRSVRE